MTEIGQATWEDNPGLIELTKLSPMQGIISLRIDRSPDFFSLLEKRGESIVFVADAGGQIIGSVSASQQEVWLDGEKETLFYIADLKIHPSQRGGIVMVRLVSQLHRFLAEQKADLLFSTAAEGNHRVTPIFEGRLGFPKFRLVGKFPVYQILPSPFKPGKGVCEWKEEAPPGFDLLDFYNQFYRRQYQLAPVWKAADLEGARTVYALENGQVRAALSLVDTAYIKQNVVIGMPFYLKVLVLLSKGLNRLTPLVFLPQTGQPIRMLNIKCFACESGREAVLKGLVQKARNLALAGHYSFLSIGLQEKDPWGKVFGSFPNIPFISTGWVASMENREEKIAKVLEGISFEDYSLV